MFHKRKRQLSCCSTSDDTQIEDYFNKRFDFCKSEHWKLPTQVYNCSEKWQIKELQDMKRRLNDVKSQLNPFNLNEWSDYTKTRDSAGYVFRELKARVKPELLTQAWCKFYECLSQFSIINEIAIKRNRLNSLHLCEAPGAFVVALNHFLSLNHGRLEWDWLVNSLNPEYEGNDLSQMIPDKRLMIHTRSHWYFGADKTGDVTAYRNYKSIVKEAQKFDEILLVTADGSVDCMSNPGEQESLVEHLHFCEVITALSVLSNDGSFVLKMFTMFESSSICLLYLLNYLFKTVHIFKPCTSKSGNSEVYVICLRYQRKSEFTTTILNQCLKRYETPNEIVNETLFTIDQIPNDFIIQIQNCSKLFMNKQIETITNNIRYFNEGNETDEFIRNEMIKNAIATYFLVKYKIKSTPSKLIPIQRYNNNKMKCNFTNVIPVLNEFIESTRNSYELEFEIGKQIDKILYSQFCNINLLKTFNLLNINNPTSLLFLNNLKQIQTNNNDLIIYVNLESDHIYVKKLLNNFDLIINCSCTINRVVLIGCLFLTRFEVGLFYLLLLCFGEVEYFSSGVIVLKNPTDQTKIISNLFQTINSKLNELQNTSSNDFKQFLLNVLPVYLLNNKSFLNCLIYYNDSTLEFINTNL